MAEGSLLLEAQADFALQLVRESAPNADKSLIISPVSISIALAMCHAGAGNETALQIAKAIASGSASNEDIRKHFSSLMAELNAPNKTYALDSANRIYVNNKFELLDTYKKILTESFEGQFENIDFSNASESAKEINAFVEKATRDKIHDLISPDMIDGLTRVILVNAIYFKGNWANKFDKNLTEEKPFYKSENNERKVQMMKKKAKFPYYENENVQVLGLPYQDEEIYMYIVLPKERFGLSEVLKNLTGKTLVDFVQRRGKSEVNVELPRFKLETSLSLGDTLKKLGIVEAFKDSADFSGMTGSKDLYISEVVHKAFIEVNEEGTEAAAATGVGFKLRSMPAKPPPTYNFTADHPFLYLLTNEEGSEAAAATGVVMTRMSLPMPMGPPLVFKADQPFFYSIVNQRGGILFTGVVADLK
uniref:Serpin domain-containing protein n=1 Tax=Acrobeloides nanus TaxID=290746 RepID=A0A914C8G6_9BILA